MFFLILASVIVLRYREALGVNRFLNISSSVLFIPENPSPAVKGSIVVVLGDDPRYYLHNKAATPYINWQLAQRHFSRLNEYDAVYAIGKNFKQDPPTYIIDKAGLMPELQNKLPFVFGEYELTDHKTVYRLKK